MYHGTEYGKGNYIDLHNEAIKMKPDAILNVRFLTSEEGGRKGSIAGKQYSCPVMINEFCGYDCRFILDGDSYFELGHEYNIPIKFLDSKSALKVIEKDKKITLWEGHTIATGEVIDIFYRET